MKKKRFWGIAAFCFLILVLSCAVSAKTPLSANGRLSVRGTKIVNAQGKAFLIKGVSTHGLSWFPEYVSKPAFRNLRDQWGVNTVRLAMYTAEYNGYCTGDEANRKALKERIDAGVRAASDLGMYVILDWHILSDGNPQQYEKQAVSFLKRWRRNIKTKRMSSMRSAMSRTEVQAGRR